ncbi:MAG TPA: NlpC/P60 family protein [Cerasibacillus sp.]|uniref:C40 family peptidase n=1 Tax=Cerasibacillus sp. TaxID=2498711 RepID=UPI002F4000D2
MNDTLQHIVKHSFMYGAILSQPIIMQGYVLQDLLEEKDFPRYGEHSERVQAIQVKLKEFSFYDDEVDGDFGILTEYAIKQFQKKHHLTSSGLIDDDTIHKIIEAEMTQYLKKIEQLSEKIYPGLQSEDVRKTQEILQYFGYYNGNIDGIYGPITAESIQLAEKEHHITLVNVHLKEPLTKVYENKKKEKKKPKQTDPTTQTTQTETPKETKVAEKPPQPVAITKSASPHIIQTAQSLIGTPYQWGGTTPSGFDCSGFLQFVYQTEDIHIPRTVSDIWNFATSVQSPSVGDLVFFETYKPGPSHAGIYLGDGKFIHAGSSRGVEISDINLDYWQTRFLGAKRISQ